MSESEQAELKQVLQKILAVQREHLEEYKTVTRRSLELQEQALARQRQFTTLYRGVIAGAGVLILLILVLILYLLRLL